MVIKQLNWSHSYFVTWRVWVHDREQEACLHYEIVLLPMLSQIDADTASTAEAATRAGCNGTAPAASLGVSLGPQGQRQALVFSEHSWDPSNSHRSNWQPQRWKDAIAPALRPPKKESIPFYNLLSQRAAFVTGGGKYWDIGTEPAQNHCVYTKGCWKCKTCGCSLPWAK